MTYFLVFLGGGLGAALRHGCNRAALAVLGPAYPFGTLMVNVAGSLALGILAGLFLSKGETDQSVRLFLTTGVLGGFTTFSAFSLDAALMWQRSDWWMLAAYVLGSVILSIVAIFTGLSVAKGIV